MKFILLHQLIIISLWSFVSGLSKSKLNVIFSVNCGGGNHVDQHGITFKKDVLEEGIVSDFGKRLDIAGIPRSDWPLFQVERYGLKTFGYDVPIEEDGDYVLVMYLAEVYFTSPEQKVFDVLLNNEHIVVDGLDIVAMTGGKGVAMQEIVPFSVQNGKILVNGEESSKNGPVRVEFAKTTFDNPKCNAFYVAKNSADEIPVLVIADPHDDVIEEYPEKTVQQKQQPNRPIPSNSRERVASGKPMENPYDQDVMSLMPVWIALVIGPLLIYFAYKI